MASNIAEKTKILIEDLKTAYKVQYDAVQPVPYIRDRLYCVDRVFVEGSIHLTTGERLESYKRIYNDPRIKSKRRILEGEPGYGKSTLTLQLAYDWCNGVPESPLSDVEILILLRLRQLGGVKSIYRAIKRFLVSDSRISETDIKDIIHTSSSVEIILDGYDEYPDQDIQVGNDVTGIIMATIFPKHDVALTTRYLPKKFPSMTKRVKLTGFDDVARDQYIRKAVVGNNEEAVKQIKLRLQENPILADLCQVPLFFVMFAHISHEKREFKKFKSVTSFFKYMITCFHEHMRNKAREDNVKQLILKYQNEHSELNKIAHEGLSKRNQQLVWKKDELIKRLGQDFYDQYVGVGILVEEQVLSHIDTDYTESYVIEVRFYHKLFCEFYASYIVLDIALKYEVYELERFLGRMDPFDLQYVYRFACGLNQTAGGKIINYLKNIKDGDKFAILCILEQTGKVDDIKETIRQLCLNQVTINGRDSYNGGDSKLVQRSTIQLLEIAARYDIPILQVRLIRCFPRVDESGLNLILESGLSLPTLESLQELWIDGIKTPNQREFAAFLDYSSQCTKLEELLFTYGYALPEIVPVASIPQSLISRNVKVFDLGSRRLNFNTGRWEDLRSEYFRQLDDRKKSDDDDESDTRTEPPRESESTPEPPQRSWKKCTTS